MATDDNAGYPHIIGYPPDDTVFTGYQQPKPPNSWKIDSNNAGYPHIIGYPPDETEFTGYQDPKPLNSWKRDDYNNGGYPYTWGFTEIVPGQTNIFLKTADGLVTLTAYYKYTGGLIPLTFIKQI